MRALWTSATRVGVGVAVKVGEGVVVAARTVAVGVLVELGDGAAHRGSRTGTPTMTPLTRVTK
jgi:hypothetical protein